ncbi:MAG: M18 family aminopeptidase [Bdellovibrionales bacterium]|nr:M18 family aminopeptidase [Bdellovibrionales bacterium]
MSSLAPIAPQKTFNQRLFLFLQKSPTPYHAVSQMATRLSEAGFERLNEGDSWGLIKGKRYFVTRGSSSLIAFTYQPELMLSNGIRMAGAHTDSPCLKVKPKPETTRKGFLQVGVEVYGGVLLAPWFDRDLSLAGRVSYLNSAGKVNSVLINFEQPIATVPSLAIHLDREVNSSRSINPQLEMPPILCQVPPDDKAEGSDRFRGILKGQIEKEHPEVKVEKVLDFDLLFYDTQPPALIGLNEDFIASARLDNLLSCHIALEALIESDGSMPSLVVFNDHEEVGSMSAEGAQGPFLHSVLQRLTGGGEVMTRVITRSLMVSADNAHGVHPNYVAKHDDNHGPIINKGPVIKINANQRYATNSETSSFYKYLSEKAGEPCQSFVIRTDMLCGSTIGPITASGIGVKTLDIGVPQFAMHSIRELAGAKDAWSLNRVLKLFFNEVVLPD